MVDSSNNDVDYDHLQQAAEWFSLLQSDEVTDDNLAQWNQWLDSDPKHRHAWQRVEHISHRFKDLPKAPARAVLDRPNYSRRYAVKTILFLSLGSGLFWQVGRHQQWGAHYRSNLGEIRTVKLEDGSQLWLNTASAIDVDYTASIRRIVLRKGEIHIQTAPDQPLSKRPLVVETKYGQLTALGTSFSVRENAKSMTLSVFDGTVKVLGKKRVQPVLVNAGEQIHFQMDRVESKIKLNSSASAWIKGMILADGMSLGRFVEELNRYHVEVIRCDPRAAKLGIVGAYPLHDIDRILKALQKSLPIDVQQPLPWWINITLKTQ